MSAIPKRRGRQADPSRYGHTHETWAALPPAERAAIRNRVKCRDYGKRNRERLRQAGQVYRERYCHVARDREALTARRDALAAQLKRIDERLSGHLPGDQQVAA